MGDLTCAVKCDVSELTAGMETSREQLNLTTTTIEVQDASWRSLAQSALQSAGQIAPAIGQIAIAAASLTSTIYYYRTFGSAIGTVGSALSGAAAAVSSFGSIALRVAGILVPEWRLITTAVSTGLLVYKVATSEMAESAYRAARGTETLSAAIDKLDESLAKLGAAASEPFAKIKAGTESWLESINPLPTILGTVEKASASYVTSWSDGIGELSSELSDYFDLIEAGLFLSEGLGAVSLEQAVAFRDETDALRGLTAASEASIAKLEAQQVLYQNIRDIQDAAASAAQQNAEVRRLGAVNTLAEIDAEVLALREKAKAELEAGQQTEDSLKKMGQLFALLADQRNKLVEGNAKKEQDALKKFQDDIAKTIQGAQEGLFKEQFGDIAFQTEKFRENGATDEDVRQLGNLLDATKRLKDAKEAAKEADRELADAAKKAEQEQKKAADDAINTWQRGEDKILSLKDQLDLVTETATKGEIAMRQALREGFSQEQAVEIGKLTDQLDKSKEKEKDVGGVAAAEFGSSAAFSNIFAAMRTASGPQERLVALAEEQNEKFDTELELMQELIDSMPDVEFVGGLL